MLIRNNNGELVGEINSSVTKEGAVITTNTMYNNGRAVAQNISVRDTQGIVHMTNTFGGKILP